MYPFFWVWTARSHSRALSLMEHKHREFRSAGVPPAEPERTPTAIGAPAPQKRRFALYRSRETDLNGACIRDMLASLDHRARTLLDVGAGKGHWCALAAGKGLDVTACDITNTLRHPDIHCIQGSVLELPIATDAFDIVTCTHTLEHIIPLRKAVSELIRVARLQLIIVVPCQREYILTLDGHVNFFLFKEKLLHALGLPGAACRKRHGDWVVVVDDPAARRRDFVITPGS